MTPLRAFSVSYRMLRVADILSFLLLKLFIFISDATGPPGSQPFMYSEHLYGADNTTPQPDVQDKQEEWNTEYNYGRNYKHSEGGEWSAGHRNHYSNENGVPDLQRGSLPQEKEFPCIEVLPSQLNVRNNGPWLFRTVASEEQKKTVQQEPCTVHNGPSKSATWPYWVPMKKNHYLKQPAPWWGADSLQTEKAPKAIWFNKQGDVYGFSSNEVKEKQFSWPASVGWSGDLGDFGEVPSPPWAHKGYGSHCC